MPWLLATRQRPRVRPAIPAPRIVIFVVFDVDVEDDVVVVVVVVFCELCWAIFFARSVLVRCMFLVMLCLFL